jgi:hypothetical protein
MIKLIVLLLILFSAPLTAQATEYVIDNESIMCESEQTYRDQIKHLVDGNRSLIRGCEINYGATPINVLDFNLHGPSKLEIKLTDRFVWTEIEFISKR